MALSFLVVLEIVESTGKSKRLRMHVQTEFHSWNRPWHAVSSGEFARNVMGIEDAHSTEFDKETENAIIENHPEDNGDEEHGGTMRLGLHPCKLKKGTKAHEAYGEELVYERHRHRFEFNNAYREQFEEAGMVLSGKSPDDQLDRNDRIERSSILHRLPVPPGIRIPPDTPTTTIPRLHRRGNGREIRKAKSAV